MGLNSKTLPIPIHSYLASSFRLLLWREGRPKYILLKLQFVVYCRMRSICTKLDGSNNTYLYTLYVYVSSIRSSTLFFSHLNYKVKPRFSFLSFLWGHCHSEKLSSCLRTRVIRNVSADLGIVISPKVSKYKSISNESC